MVHLTQDDVFTVDLVLRSLYPTLESTLRLLQFIHKKVSSFVPISLFVQYSHYHWSTKCRFKFLMHLNWCSHTSIICVQCISFSSFREQTLKATTLFPLKPRYVICLHCSVWECVCVCVCVELSKVTLLHQVTTALNKLITFQIIHSEGRFKWVHIYVYSVDVLYYVCLYTLIDIS